MKKRLRLTGEQVSMAVAMYAEHKGFVLLRPSQVLVRSDGPPWARKLTATVEVEPLDHDSAVACTGGHGRDYEV